MPIMRQPIQIRDTRNMTTVRSQRSGLGDVLSQQSQYYFQKASQYGRMFIAEGEQQAEQWVREAIFSEDENGVPQLPPEPSKVMGSAVRETYDKRMAEAYTLRLRSSIRNQINEAQNSNIGDYEGFQKQTDASARRMLETLPVEMRGAFQSLWTSEMVNAGASVGREQALILLEIQRADFHQNFEEKLSSLVLNYEQGPVDHEAAKLSFKYIMEEIINAPNTLITASQKNEKIEQLIYRVGKSRMINDFKLKDRNTSELTRLAAALENPNSNEYKEFSKYFAEYSKQAAELGLEDISPWVTPTGGYDSELRKTLNMESAAQFAKEIRSEFMPLARQRAAEAEAQFEYQNLVNDIFNGVLSSSGKDLPKKARIVFNNELANRAGLETLDWTDWVYGDSKKMSEDTINKIMMQVKTAGFLPQSLQQAVTRLSIVDNEQEFMNTYDVYVRLRDQANIMGNTKDLASLVPEDALLRLEMAELLLAKGATNDNTLPQVNEMIKTWKDLEAQDPNWENAHNEFARAFRNEGYGSALFGGNEVADALESDRKKLDLTLKEVLKDELNLGENTNVHELNEAVALFKKYFRLQATASEKPLETALDFTRKTLNGRYYHDSKYLPPGTSSKMAPEIYYSDRIPTTLTAFLGQFWRKNISAGISEAGESVLYGSWWRPYADNIEWKEGDLGAALKRASVFDIIMDQKIDELMKTNPDFQDKAKFSLPYEKDENGNYVRKKGLIFNRNGLYEAGVHYYLVPTLGKGGIPTYDIRMIGAGMQNEVAFTLAKDVSVDKEFKEMTGEINTYDEIHRYARAKDIMLNEYFKDGNVPEILQNATWFSAQVVNDFLLKPWTGRDNEQVQAMREAIDTLAEHFRNNP